MGVVSYLIVLGLPADFLLLNSFFKKVRTEEGLMNVGNLSTAGKYKGEIRYYIQTYILIIAKKERKPKSLTYEIFYNMARNNSYWTSY